MIVSGTDLFMTRGDSESISVTISGYDIQPGDFVEMTIRQRPASPVVIYKKVTEFSENKAIISILPEETSDLSTGDYIYDIQLTFFKKISYQQRKQAFYSWRRNWYRVLAKQ